MRNGSLLVAAALVVVLPLLLAPARALAQDAERPDSFSGPTGTISGRVFDGETGAPLENATVILGFPEPEGGGEPRQEVATTGPAGDYEFDAMPSGFYSLSFIKSGYRASAIADFEVKPDRDNVADFPMPRSLATTGAAGGGGGDILELDAYVVEASVVGDLMADLELRMESDQLVNLLSSEDLSKFAASDVADALKRVAGVNIVEGQFAIIRGLEDRYSSTLFNGAPVPSPDPDSQSVQLDLFPSDVVSNLVIAKNFAPESPSNSAGGSIDIETREYPEELQLRLSLGTGFEEGARDRFLEFESGSTAGAESEGKDIVESDVTASLGGQLPFAVLDRTIEFKGVVNHEIDYRTHRGFQETREPRLGFDRIQTGGLALGELGLSEGRFDQTESTREEQLTAYLGFGFELDDEGEHRVDASIFYTKKEQETVELHENGFLPGLDYSELIQLTLDEDDLLSGLQAMNQFASLGSRLAGAEGALRQEITDTPDRGALWLSSFGRTNSFERKRALNVYQLNGEHEFDLWDGVEIRWVANHATTNQQQTSLGMRFFYEPCGYSDPFACPSGVTRAPVPTRFPVRVQDLGVGSYFASGASGGIVFSENEIRETQWFGRIDLEQAASPTDYLDLNLTAGVWWEKSRRTVDAFFVESVTVNRNSQWALDSATLTGLGGSLFGRLDQLDGNRASTSRSGREITAGHLGLKSTFWQDIDVVGGLRLEKIFIDSRNDPFTGEIVLNRPAIFPPAYLFFDRVDNPDPVLGEGATPSDRSFNDQILGIDVPINPDTGFVDLLTRAQISALVDGEIDELKVLPSVALAWRATDELTFRGSFSQTVARPSFRELGYYVTVEPGTDERTVGNPQLQLSDVLSYDLRAEYVFGDLGDLFAVSAFYKTIDDPIESIFVRNELDRSSGSAALYRTFFNNPNTARLWGFEIEGRKHFDFLRRLGLDFPGVEIFESLSIGGNFTWIEAKVGRSDVELERAEPYFVLTGDDRALFSGLRRSRRLFGQPEWIVNADLTFDHEDWGTRVTLAVFAISDVLDAAGSAGIAPRGIVESMTIDRYLDQFYQLDLVASQEIWRGLSLKLSVKNLTDSNRRRVYDREQTRRKVTERARRLGRDWSVSLGYRVEF